MPVRKQGAWKEAGIHIDQMQHVSSEVQLLSLVVRPQFQGTLHFVCKQMQPLMEYLLHCLNVVLTVPSMLDGWICWGFSGTQCEFLRLPLRKCSEAYFRLFEYILCCQKLVKAGLDGFRNRRIPSIHSPIISLHRNERLCSSVPHKNPC
jgi:hypothetical protein